MFSIVTINEPPPRIVPRSGSNEVFLRLWTHHESELRAFDHACLLRAAEWDE